MNHDYLIMDMRHLLDSSAVGQNAARSLEQKFQADKARYDEMMQKVSRAAGAQKEKLQQEASRFEAESINALERDRARLRESLLARAAPILARLAAERGAQVVLDRSAVVFFQADADITDIVVQEVDAGGALQ